MFPLVAVKSMFTIEWTGNRVMTLDAFSMCVIDVIDSVTGEKITQNIRHQY